MGGYYDGEYCWSITAESNQKCTDLCDALTGGSCSSNWNDENCVIMEDKLGIHCDDCIEDNNVAYPGYDEVSGVITCKYRPISSNTCNTNSGDVHKLCPCTLS